MRPASQAKAFKLSRSPHVEADAGRNSGQKTRKIVIHSVTKGPNSLLVKFGKRKFRALLDSGAEVSLIHRRVYDSLKSRPKLQKPNLNLATAGNTPLHIDGFAEIEFTLGGLKMTHKFYVVRNLNRNIIIGLDWLQARGVRVYHDLGCIRVHSTYVPLVEDIHIASVARLKHKTKVPPQSAHICTCRVRQHPELPVLQDYEVTPYESGALGNEPGLLVTNCVAKLSGNRRISVMLVNTTNKTLSFKQGTPVAHISQLVSSNIQAVDKLSTQDLIRSPKQAGSSKHDHDFDDVDAPSEFKQRIIRLLRRNSDLFAKSDADLSHTDTVRMKLDTGHHPPIKLKPYRTQLNNRKVIDKAVDEMLDAKIIQRSRSEWSFPVVIVDKKDGTKRFCVDFRKLNKVTKSNSYPLPVIDDILALLGKAKFFTSLDLKSGYWQVLMDDNDKEKTAFTCHRGLFHFNVMPFGLTTAPAVFQELMNRVLEGYGEFTTAYLDDILIYSETLEQHLVHIQKVFDRLRSHHLRLKLKKCSFLKAETNYLGFVINEHGIQPEQKKVNVIKNLSPPTTVREVRSFIGMCSYYRRFIPRFSSIAEPIIALTRKYARFNWSQQCQEAFDKLKQALIELPLLCFPDTSLPYKLYTDASDKCVGACLTQTVSEHGQQIERPIYYLSHRLSDTQTRWATIEKEAYAIFYSLSKLDHYLHNAEFTIFCDHKPLKYLLESPMQNRKVSLWALSIAGYNCKIEYLAGTENSVADLLSRVPPDTAPTDDSQLADPDVSGHMYQISALNSNKFNPKEFARCRPRFEDKVEKPNYREEIDISVEQDKDEGILQIKQGLRNDSLSKSLAKKHIMIDNILYYISYPDSDPILRLYIPEHLQKTIIQEHHTSLGHLGINKTYDAIRSKYFWINLYKDVTNFVTSCVTCQTRSAQKTRPPVQETDTPPFAWAKCAVDVSGPYPTSLSGNKYIVSFIDLFSGYPEAFACPDKSAQTIAHLIVDEIFPRYSCPLELLSDNGSENVNKVVKETEALNIHHVTTSFYHPESNGVIERYHRTLADVISKKLQTDAGSWDMFLNQALAAIRFGVNESTKCSPFFLLFNREVILPIDNILKPRR